MGVARTPTAHDVIGSTRRRNERRYASRAPDPTSMPAHGVWSGSQPRPTRIVAACGAGKALFESGHACRYRAEPRGFGSRRVATMIVQRRSSSAAVIRVGPDTSSGSDRRTSSGRAQVGHVVRVQVPGRSRGVTVMTDRVARLSSCLWPVANVHPSSSRAPRMNHRVAKFAPDLVSSPSLVSSSDPRSTRGVPGSRRPAATEERPGPCLRRPNEVRSRRWPTRLLHPGS